MATQTHTLSRRMSHVLGRGTHFIIINIRHMTTFKLSTRITPNRHNIDDRWLKLHVSAFGKRIAIDGDELMCMFLSRLSRNSAALSMAIQAVETISRVGRALDYLAFFSSRHTHTLICHTIHSNHTQFHHCIPTTQRRECRQTHSIPLFRESCRHDSD